MAASARAYASPGSSPAATEACATMRTVCRTLSKITSRDGKRNIASGASVSGLSPPTFSRYRT